MRIRLIDRLAMKTVPDRIEPLTDELVENLNSRWIPAFHQRSDAQVRDEDFLMWRTGKGFYDQLIHRDELRSFALIVGDDVQGVLLLQQETQPSRLEVGARLLYVRYLATAPWNRRDKIGLGQFRGVGTWLMAWGVSESHDAGCAGRLGLHALRGSEEFYRLLGMQDLGLDAARRGMNYFELSSVVADELSAAVWNNPVGASL